ncbi:MBOAT family O-acyltransferase [Massiliimalia timonensis]|uniref:MBOAT family protein n=1 Tax=Massiliimalia timonensis TaxID=1987501 RepID=A0A8J6NYD5_9FIRM|nr:MBOAT family O-acyltransferase [Massiliimalia timonensis]MBC8609546.1 MBOAT family protein [Massiliimalia timonensis]
MVFSSIFFLFLFLPLVLLANFLAPKFIRNAILWIFSLVFYAWGEPVYVILMLFSTVFNYVMGLDIESRQLDRKAARNSLILAVAVNLFILGFFKYSGFLIDTVNQIFSVDIPYKKLSLPIGISFYTFQTLSYILDIYWKKIRAQKNFINFGLYVAMFPQLIAGPIVRYIDIEPQLTERRVTLASFGLGTEYFIKGLAKKVLLANSLGMVYTSVQEMQVGTFSVLTAWVGILAYTFQIYFDFSGYSDMAIGLGKMFGFQFMKNFDYPYISTSVTEFWRRWHISLGSWFREYVYIPLGGNRVSVPKHIRNILIVWALTGLWHGASWNFVLWGLYYGLLLLVEKYFLTPLLQRCPSWVKHLYTMLFVIIGWVLFSNTSITDAFGYLGNLFGVTNGGIIDPTGLYLLKTNLILMVLAVLVCTPWAYNQFKRLIQKFPAGAIVINLILWLVSVAYLVYETYNPFLYFRF